MSNARTDDNNGKTKLAVDESGNPARLLVDPVTGRLLIELHIVSEPSSPVLNTAKIDENKEYIALGVNDSGTPTPLHVDSRNGYLFCDLIEE